MTPTTPVRLHLGRLFMTESILTLARSGTVEILKLLERHATGDAGDVSEARKEMNAAAIEGRGLVVSRYQVAPALNVVILTNEECSVSKCMLLSEFLDDLHD